MDKRSDQQGFQALFQRVTADSVVCGTLALFVTAAVLLMVMMQVLSNH